MKTPREILFERHQAAAPKLDAIRQTAVASVCDRRIANSPAVTGLGGNLREFLFSLRWHLAGLGTAWLVIVLLNLSVGHSASLAAAIPRGKIPSPRIILASLREHRRELLELIQPAEWREAQPQKSILPQPRSQRYHEILTT
jgi:hypothetical protein